MPEFVPLIVWLLIALSFKHMLADFTLQNRWMATGKEATAGWFLPLAAHAGLHGLGTALVALLFVPEAWWLGLLDFAIHGVIDRAKAVTGRVFGLEPGMPAYWWLFGLDQWLHQLTNIGLAVGMLWLAVI